MASSIAPQAAAAAIAPTAGDLKTEYSANARSKCKLCNSKIAKGAWRVQLAVQDYYSTTPKWQSCHAACWLRNLADGNGTRPTTQSMGYHDGPTDKSWSAPPPPITPPASEVGAAVAAAMAAADPTEDPSLGQLLPTAALRGCYSAAVAAKIPGAGALEPADRDVLELVMLCQRLTNGATAALDGAELTEAATLDQPANDHGDKLKGKFVQYSPNSRAHCRDCSWETGLLNEGDIRVGASVFSSSSRHAGDSINYWCIACMCKRPAVQRAARLNPDALEKVLPGAELLAAPDVDRVCKLLKIPVPDPAARAAMAQGRNRTTRTGRTFGTWGGPGGGGGGGGGEAGEAGGGGEAVEGRSKRARRN